MGSFSIKTKSRCWVITIHTANMLASGLTEEDLKNYQKIADHFIKIWCNSGKGRIAAIVICISAEGLLHAHMAVYCPQPTTLSNVSKILYHSHVEPQLGGKEQLLKYLKKEGEFAEKGETILYAENLDQVQENRGKRTDLQIIEDMLISGCTPQEIMNASFSFARYEKMVKAQFLSRKLQNAPVIKQEFPYTTYITGEPGAGKTFVYEELIKTHSVEEIYLFTDHESGTGGLDYYLDQGAPPILFIDDLKGNMKYSQLLQMLDKYAKTQLHGRYVNVWCLWEKVYITSVYGPEQLYEMMVPYERRKQDNFKQLLRRIKDIHFKFIDSKGNHRTFMLPAEQYTNYEDLKRLALSSEDDFYEIETDEDDNPFLDK